MKEPVATESEAKTEPVLLDTRRLIDWMFGTGQTGMNLLRVVVSGAYASSILEMWLRARHADDGSRSWHQADGGWAPKSAPTLDTILATYASVPLADRPTSTSQSYSVPGTEVSISPYLCLQMSAQIQAPWPCVWAAVKVRVFPPSYGQPTGVIDVADHQNVRERFLSMHIPPHTIVDEGDRIVGLWKLDVPFTDAEDPIPEGGMTAFQQIARQRSPIAPRRGARLLHKLAHSVHGDIVDMAKSENAVFMLPGQKVDLRMGDAPSLLVSATCFDPDGRVSIEELEAMADSMAANLRG